MNVSATPRALTSLSRMERLSSLQPGTSCPSLRLNRTGELRGLAGCSALRSLTVLNLAGDSGMDALTQLHSLHLSLPDHAPNLDSLPAGVLDSFV